MANEKILKELKIGNDTFYVPMTDENIGMVIGESNSNINMPANTNTVGASVVINHPGKYYITGYVVFGVGSTTGPTQRAIKTRYIENGTTKGGQGLDIVCGTNASTALQATSIHNITEEMLPATIQTVLRSSKACTTGLSSLYVVRLASFPDIAE